MSADEWGTDGTDKNKPGACDDKASKQAPPKKKVPKPDEKQ